LVAVSLFCSARLCSWEALQSRILPARTSSAVFLGLGRPDSTHVRHSIPSGQSSVSSGHVSDDDVVCREPIFDQTFGNEPDCFRVSIAPEWIIGIAVWLYDDLAFHSTNQWFELVRKIEHPCFNEKSRTGAILHRVELFSNV